MPAHDGERGVGHFRGGEDRVAVRVGELLVVRRVEVEALDDVLRRRGHDVPEVVLDDGFRPVRRQRGRPVGRELGGRLPAGRRAVGDTARITRGRLLRGLARRPRAGQHRGPLALRDHDRAGGDRHVVPVQDRVEHHVELAVILPPVDGIVGEQEDPSPAAVAARDVNRKRPVADLVRALHQPAEDGVLAPDVARQHVALIRWRDRHQRPPEILDGHQPFCVAVEHRVIQPEHFRVDDRARRVEVR